MTEPSIPTEENFIDRLESTGVEVHEPTTGKIVAIMDTALGNIYVFCDPPYTDLKLGTPCIFDGTRCIRWNLSSQEAVDESTRWTKISIERHT